ncbi:MAG: BrnT family toxin [Acidobacteriota bacterium]
MKYFEWDNEKNERLKEERGISFEEVVFHIEQGDILDILKHPNQEKYKGQQVFVIDVEGYVYSVPYLEMENKVILKTIIPSRKATKKYLGGVKSNG